MEGFRAYDVLLALFQLAGFATCGWLLAFRDRATLMASENRGIGRLAVGAILVIPFMLTDFRRLRRISRSGSVRWARCWSSPRS